MDTRPMHVAHKLHLLDGAKSRPMVAWRAIRTTMRAFAEAWRVCRERDHLADLDNRSRDDIGRHRVAAELARPVGPPWFRKLY